MKKHFVLLMATIVSGIILFSCQRELFFDNLPSQGSLQSSAGNCLPKSISGTFTAGDLTGDTNFINVSVRITRPGAFTITTDTINGYAFSAGGNFSDTGINTVRLAAKGKPIAAGIDNFTVRYNSSTCSIPVSVAAGLSGPAVFTLLGAPNTCSPIVITGSYISDVPMISYNTVTVTLTVSVGGTYSISTSTVNGYKFFGSGTVFPGTQTVSLRGFGTPILNGTDVFTVSAGTSACTFAVAVTAPVIVTGTDYFPIATGNFWTYDDLMNSGDTIKRMITDSVTISGNLFHSMHEYNMYGGDTVLQFRKTGNDYFQYGPVDILTSSLKYVPSVFAQVNFLKQALITGDTWSSAEYVGNLFSGQPVYLQYNFICAESNTAITVNGNSFINVYHIVMLPQVRSSLINPYNSTGEEVNLYYAKGIGLVYAKGTNNGFRKLELKLSHWRVN